MDTFEMKNRTMEERHINVDKHAEASMTEEAKNLTREASRELTREAEKNLEETGYVNKERDLFSDEADESEVEIRPARQATLHKKDHFEKKREKSNIEKQKKIQKLQNEIDVVRLNYQNDQTEKTAKKVFDLRKKIVEYAREIKENNAINDGTYTEEKKRALKAEAAGEMVNLYDDLIQEIPANKEKERNGLYKEKEGIQIKMHSWLKRNKIEHIENETERTRELKTFERHKRFDRLKKIFYKPTKLAIEGAEYNYQGKHLVNVGRAFMGGTKPMYYFEDRNAPIMDGDRIIGYKKYLYKEAVNCIGMKKVQGALVTEAASKLQSIVCGEYAIGAFAAKDEQGEVMGSFQDMIELADEEHRVDLFKWQAAPDNSLSNEIKEEVLREHTLDWLLCNFDTKGENFLHRKKDGHLSSFDKEASFSFIESDEAQHMSTTYCPHNNDTVYNIMFQEYIKGTLDLDFTQMRERAQRISAMNDDEYIGLFEEMLRQKYKDESKYEEVKGLILRRKTDLVEEYNRFITHLQEERHNTAGA